MAPPKKATAPPPQLTIDSDSSDDDFVPDASGSDDEDGSVDAESSSDEHDPAPGKTPSSGNNDPSLTGEIEPIDLEDGDDGSKPRKGPITRSQRRKLAEEKEKETPNHSTSEPSVDVLDIWKRIKTTSTDVHGRPLDSQPAPDSLRTYGEEYITIKRTYRFAGETKTEDRRVLKSSAEAQAHLSSLAKTKDAAKPDGQDLSKPDEADDRPPDSQDQSVSEQGRQENQGRGQGQEPLVRPLKRPSRFDPNPVGIVRSLPPDLQLRWPREPTFTTLLQRYQSQIQPGQTPVIGSRPGRGGGMTVFSTRGGGRGRGARSGGNTTRTGIHGTTTTTTAAAAANFPGMASHLGAPTKATKLNTVQKSRYDWAGYVDKAGIADELDRYGKAKESYLGRSSFLAESEMRREQLRREGTGGRPGRENQAG